MNETSHPEVGLLLLDNLQKRLLCKIYVGIFSCQVSFHELFPHFGRHRFFFFCKIYNLDVQLINCHDFSACFLFYNFALIYPFPFFYFVKYTFCKYFLENDKLSFSIYQHNYI